MNTSSRFPNPFPPPFAHAWGDDAFGLWAEFRIETSGESVVQNFRWIEPGTFWMGSPKDEPERLEDEGPRHEVTMTPRASAISSVTLGPGNTPPWPGLAPWLSLISTIFTWGERTFSTKCSGLKWPCASRQPK